MLENKVILHSGDILDPYFLLSLFREHGFDEVYHLAAQSHVGTSFKLQLYTGDVNALGTLRLIQTILTLDLGKRTKFYNVSCTGSCRLLCNADNQRHVHPRLLAKQ